MLVKKGFLSLAMALPLVSTMAQAGHRPDSLEGLRNRCFEFRQNAQINRFNIKILCSGSYTHWDHEEGQYALPNFGKVLTHTTCKDNRFQTGEAYFDLQYPEHVGSCSRYVKTEMRAPEGMGISISIQNCEDLTPGNVEALCNNEVHNYCADQFYAAGGHAGQQGGASSLSSSSDQGQGQGQYGQEGLCSLHVVDSIDTCAMYQ